METKKEGLSRRELMAGAAAAAIAATAPLANAAPGRRAKRAGQGSKIAVKAIRRFMAASATLPGGRVLVAGGYDRPWNEGEPAPSPLRSAVLFDPASGQVQELPPMAVARARHAAVALPDGRIAVIGGLGLAPLASVEVYDPGTNAWTAGPSLAQPRYDHTASVAGTALCVIGGSSTAMIASVEVLRVDQGAWSPA